ncbi:MAG: hypothetical protein HYX21_00495 [Candidatus Yanofskybacteria bacterium]|nr:hypothetical protein [Candidatus Yanofskybacteria bacterium]
MNKFREVFFSGLFVAVVLVTIWFLGPGSTRINFRYGYYIRGLKEKTVVVLAYNPELVSSFSFHYSTTDDMVSPEILFIFKDKETFTQAGLMLQTAVNDIEKVTSSSRSSR